jgi:hypothetical protein
MNHVGFPVWISATRYLNLLFMAFLARSEECDRLDLLRRLLAEATPSG